MKWPEFLGGDADTTVLYAVTNTEVSARFTSLKTSAVKFELWHNMRKMVSIHDRLFFSVIWPKVTNYSPSRRDYAKPATWQMDMHAVSQGYSNNTDIPTRSCSKLLVKWKTPAIYQGNGCVGKLFDTMKTNCDEVVILAMDNKNTWHKICGLKFTPRLHLKWVIFGLVRGAIAKRNVDV